MAKITICLTMSRMKVLGVMFLTMMLIIGMTQIDSLISTLIDNGQTVDNRQYYTFDNLVDYNKSITTKYAINCANLDQIQIKTIRDRRGKFKTTDVGIFNGEKVAVKYFYKDTLKEEESNELRQFLFMKEIFMLNQLDHPGLIKMLGYCVKPFQENSIKFIPRRMGITAVYEFGEIFNVTTLSLSVEQRIKYVLDLADLLLYLENSPLGSLRIGDFKSTHFLMVKNIIKLIDFDYFNNVEPLCKTKLVAKCEYNITCYRPKNSGNVPCGPGTRCYSGICYGFNAKINMARVNDAFLQFLLQEQFFPTNMRTHISNLTSQLNNNDIDAYHLIRELRQLKIN